MSGPTDGVYTTTIGAPPAAAAAAAAAAAPPVLPASRWTLSKKNATQMQVMQNLAAKGHEQVVSQQQNGATAKAPIAAQEAAQKGPAGKSWLNTIKNRFGRGRPTTPLSQQANITNGMTGMNFTHTNPGWQRPQVANPASGKGRKTRRARKL